jgi:hypothetical protein
MSEIYPPLRACSLCGEIEPPSLRKQDLKYRAVPAKALKDWGLRQRKKEEETFNSGHKAWMARAFDGSMTDAEKDDLARSFALRDLQEPMPLNIGWSFFLNRVDPSFFCPYCCGDCIHMNELRCSNILGGSPTEKDWVTELLNFRSLIGSSRIDLSRKPRN